MFNSQISGSKKQEAPFNPYAKDNYETMKKYFLEKGYAPGLIDHVIDNYLKQGLPDDLKQQLKGAPWN